MPVTQGSLAINNVAARLAEQIAGGTGAARTTFGAKDAAFAWTTGLPRGLWDFVATASVEGGAVSTIHVQPTATPAKKVARGEVKPDAVTLVPASHPLIKYAGMAKFQFEQYVYSDVLPQAVTTTLVGQCLAALESDCLAQLASTAGAAQTGDTSWPAAILGGIAQVAAAGGNPGLLVISPADLAAAVGTPTQLQFRGDESIMTFLGLDLHLSPAAVPGTAYVLDPSSVLVAESVESPACVADGLSRASTNEMLVVADVMAVPVVTSPGLVVELTPTI